MVTFCKPKLCWWASSSINYILNIAIDRHYYSKYKACNFNLRDQILIIGETFFRFIWPEKHLLICLLSRSNVLSLPPSPSPIIWRLLGLSDDHFFFPPCLPKCWCYIGACQSVYTRQRLAAVHTTGVILTSWHSFHSKWHQCHRVLVKPGGGQPAELRSNLEESAIQ